MCIKSKIALLSVIGLLIISSVFGTMAYFRDTDTSHSTFTVGHVRITMSETNVDGQDKFGVANNAERDLANKYHLVPGGSYIKDPTITVESDSEDAFVYMMVEVNGYKWLADAFPSDQFPSMYKDSVIDLNQFFNIDNSAWQYCGVKISGQRAQYRFAYKSKVENTAGDKELSPLFTTMVIPGATTGDNIKVFKDVSIDVKAFAVQASGFDDYNEAWKLAFSEESDEFDLI